MIKLLVASFCAIVLVVAVTADNVCEGLEDGAVPEWGCRSYTTCKDGKEQIVDCTPDVFNPTIMECDDPATTPAPCGLWRNCTGREDKRYADLEFDCRAYYTCLYELYYGHEVCAEGLVFDEFEQFCNWPENVAPPCGTADAEKKEKPVPHHF